MHWLYCCLDYVRCLCSDASSNVRAQAVKDYCNAHDSSHISFREGDFITVGRTRCTVCTSWIVDRVKGTWEWVIGQTKHTWSTLILMRSSVVKSWKRVCNDFHATFSQDQPPFFRDPQLYFSSSWRPWKPSMTCDEHRRFAHKLAVFVLVE